MSDTRILIGVFSVVLLAGTLAACGSDEESASSGPSATPISQGETSTVGKPSSRPQEAKSSRASSQASPEAIQREETKEANKFVPKQHDDSGGGVEQYRVPKGFDNSAQEYGEEAGTSDLEEAAAAMHGYFDARVAKNWAAACEYLSKAALEQVENLGAEPDEAGCATAMEGIWERVLDSELEAEAREADAGGLRIEGSHGFLFFFGLEGQKELLQMDKEDGQWKVAALEPFPL